MNKILAELEKQGTVFINYIKGELSQITETTSEEVEVPPYLYSYIQYQQDCTDSTQTREIENWVYSDKILEREDIEEIMFFCTDIDYDTVDIKWERIC